MTDTPCPDESGPPPAGGGPSDLSPKEFYGDERDHQPETAEFHLGPGKGLREVRLDSLTPEEKKGTASKIHPFNLFYTERAAEIYQKRLDGWTIRRIAAHYKVTQGTVHKVLQKEFLKTERRARESQDMIKQIHRDRLEQMYDWIRPLMEAGSPRAMDMGIKILERISKLEGLDAPEKKQVDVTMTELTDHELVQQAERAGLSVPAVLRALAADEVIDAEIVPPEAIRDRPPPPPAETPGPQGREEVPGGQPDQVQDAGRAGG